MRLTYPLAPAVRHLESDFRSYLQSWFMPLSSGIWSWEWKSLISSCLNHSLGFSRFSIETWRVSHYEPRLSHLNSLSDSFKDSEGKWCRRCRRVLFRWAIWQIKNQSPADRELYWSKRRSRYKREKKGRKERNLTNIISFSIKTRINNQQINRSNLLNPFIFQDLLTVDCLFLGRDSTSDLSSRIPCEASESCLTELTVDLWYPFWFTASSFFMNRS